MHILIDFDLPAYAQRYSGYTKLQRLQFIADQCMVENLIKLPNVEEIRKDSLRILLHELKDSNSSTNMDLYEEISTKYGKELGGGDMDFDKSFAENVRRTCTQKLLRLEQELNSYKTNLIKESIRMGHNEIGEFYLRKGELDSALKSFVRTRDFCTMNKHIADMCLNVMKVSIHSKNYVHVSSYAKKATQAVTKDDALSKVSSKVNCCHALALLNSADYKAAAHKFLTCDPEIGDSLKEVIHPADIATYASLCALASLSRSELKAQVMENQPFKNFLEHVPHLREVLAEFHAGKYASCFQRLDALKPLLLMDIHLCKHVDRLFTEIRNRAVIQFVHPYTTVNIVDMAKTFNTNVEELEKELCRLIQKGRISARIDSHNKILHEKSTDTRGTTYKNAFEIGRNYIVNTRALLLRMDMLKNDLVVATPGKSSRMKRLLLGDN